MHPLTLAEIMEAAQSESADSYLTGLTRLTETSAKVVLSTIRHPEPVEGSVLSALARMGGTDLSTPLRSAQEDRIEKVNPVKNPQ
jgi:hypothetical protein